jgi:superfamily II DNA or RNA helicase
MHYRENLRFERGLIVAEEAPQGQPELWQHDARTGNWITHAMNNWRLETSLDDKTTLWEPVQFRRPGLKTLRADQLEAIAAWKRTGRGVVVMPTGSGKTEVALGIMREIASHTLFVAPTRALAYQLAGRIEEDCGVEVGFIGDSTYRLRPICVTTYDSAGIKMEHLGNYFKLIVFDECHHLPGDLRADAARMSAAPFRLGLTATPRRSDGGERYYEDLIGPVCYELPLSVVRGTVLSEYKIKRIPVYLTDQEQAHYDALSRTIREHMAARLRDVPSYRWEDVIKNPDSDPEARQAFLALIKKKSIEEHASAKLDVLEDLFHEHLQQVVVFTGSNIMARMVSTRFLIPCLLAHCGRKEREEILRGYRVGEYRAIIANKVLNEGVDVPAAKVGIVIGGSGSEREAVQRLGRILRKRGQQSATLYEVVCAGTGEEERSRKRRRNDAYQGRSAL